jgi:hypothetical protein
MTFHIDAIPPAELARIRAAGHDTQGDPFTAREADGAEPLRCCLRLARAGERIALIAYRPTGTAGAYAENGPVFVHAEPCEGYPTDGGWPPEFRDRQQVLRAYDAMGRIADAILVEGTEAEDGIAKLLADPEHVVVHSRNVLYGCYMFAVSR